MQNNNKYKNSKKKLSIYDDIFKDSFIDDGEILYLKTNYELKKSNFVSIMDLINKNQTILKKDFLKWNTNLPKIKIKDQSVIDRMITKEIDYRSFWWGTTIHNRSPLENPHIVNIFKIREIERLIETEKYSQIIYIGSDPTIKKLLLEITESLDISFNFKIQNYKNYVIKKTKSLLTNYFPYFLMGIAYFLIIFFRWVQKIFVFDNRTEKSLRANKFVISYLSPYDQSYALKNLYRSKYFSKFHDIVETSNAKVNWLLLYSPNSNLTYTDSLKFIKNLNRNTKISKNQNFFMIEHCLSLYDFMIIIVLFFKNYLKFSRIHKLKVNFKLENSKFNFFNILSYNFNSSLYGSSAMRSCIYAIAFDKIFKDINAKSDLYYIFENSTWEQFALFAWKKYHKGTSLAIAHSPSISADMNLKSHLYGDLENGDLKKCKVLPDKITTPGKLFTNKMINSGWQKSKFIELESLKYSYLFDKHTNRKVINKDDEKILLVITGYMKTETTFQLKILLDSLRRGDLKKFKKIIIKPHHDCPVNDILSSLNFVKSSFEISDKGIDCYNSNSTTCFLANSTSAIFDVIYCKMKYLITGSDRELNLNPLYNLVKINYINNADDLQLQIKANSFEERFNYDDLFYTSNRELSWLKILSKK